MPPLKLVGLKPGENPRDALKGHCERGSQKFIFTYKDYAAAIQRSVATVKKAATRKGDQPGELDPRNISSVAAFMAKAMGWMRLSAEERKIIEAVRAEKARS